MNRAALPTSLLAACLAWGMAAAAPPQQAEAPPPPGMDDPGVKTDAATVPAAQGDAGAVDAQATQDPLAPLPKPDARLVRDKASRDAAATSQRIAGSDVTRRQQGNDTVEEYRENGRVWMVRIVRPDGPTQTFFANDGSGRLVRDPDEGPVSPVYYTLYEWK
jgi:hypothetical protein